jgi:hypothetical protein
MPNGCSITITRGKNKGKICSSINKICRHQNITCPHCNDVFAYKHTYASHSRGCNIIEPHLTTKKKINVVKKFNLLDRIHKLEKRNRDLEDKVKEVETQPRNINNIMVIGTDFYQELVTMIGKDRALEFLTCSAVSGKPIDVIDKLYLEGKDPMCYPIACRNTDHFRYLSDDSNVVDDHGGAIIGDIVINRLQNAFLMAANEIISKQVGGEGDGDSDVLRSVQQHITTVYDKHDIVYQLAAATSNAKHPFFRDTKNTSRKNISN